MSDLGFNNTFVRVGLVSLAVFFGLEYTKPAMIYDEKGQPKNELVTPVSIAVMAGLLVLIYNYNQLGGSAGGGQTSLSVTAPAAATGAVAEAAFEAPVVASTDTSALEGWADGSTAYAANDALPPETFAFS